MRAATPPFDERAYGFANLTDLLRAAHKDNLVRMERDRQGVIRVFQSGNAAPVVLAEASTPPPSDMEPMVITTGPEVIDAVVEPVVAVEVDEDADPDDVNGNVAEPAARESAPAPTKGKSRRRPQPQAQARGGRKPAAKKKS